MDEQQRSGWYPDPQAPDDAGRRSWWDGTAWSSPVRWDGTDWVPDAGFTGEPVHGGRRRRWPWVVGAAVVVVALGIGACGVLYVSRWRVTDDTSTDHRKQVSTGETATLDAQLVPVRGYGYQNVSEAERDAEIERIHQQERDAGMSEGSLVAAVSLHSVKADDDSQNTASSSVGPEVGFLQLSQPVDGVPVGAEEELATSTMQGKRRIDRLDLSGTAVFVFENSSSDSRYTYVWVRDGVIAAFDGATRAPMERWLGAYLAEPVRVPGETTVLASALPAVAGYGFDNRDLSRSDRTMLVTEPMGDVPVSYHLVTDTDGTIGKLLLAEVDRGVDTSSLAAKELAGIAAVHRGFTLAGTITLAGVPVAHLHGPDGDAYVWSRNGIAGVFITTEHADRAQPFLTDHLAASAGATG
jgi:hypothetical protein